MDRESIRGYARATRALYDALCAAWGEDNVPIDIAVRTQENPKKGLAELTHLVMTNHLMTDELSKSLQESLWEVDSDQPADLDMEDRGTFILDWLKARGRQVGTLTVPEAATELGLTLQAVRDLIVTDPAKLEPGRVLGSKVKGRWLLDRESYESYRGWRENRR